MKYIDNGYVAIIWVDYGPGLFKVSRVIKTKSLLEWKECPDACSKQINDTKKKEIILKAQLYFALFCTSKDKMLCK